MVRPADDEYDSSPTTKPQPQPQPPPPPPPPSTSATGKGTAVVNDSFKVSGKKNHHDSAAADNISSPVSLMHPLCLLSTERATFGVFMLYFVAFRSFWICGAYFS